MSKQKSHRWKGQDGYTLVELLAVMVILVLIAGFVAPQVVGYLGKAKSDAATIQIENLVNALDLYYLDTGSLPSTEEGLAALVVKPTSAETWNGPYVRKEASLIDPWGTPYRYSHPGKYGRFDLFSLGPDKKEGGEGENADITSWN